jgi:hypothetical protein
VATRLALLGATCLALVADPGFPKGNCFGNASGNGSGSSGGGSANGGAPLGEEDQGPSPAACAAAFLAHSWVQAALSNRLARSGGDGNGFAAAAAASGAHAGRRLSVSAHNGSGAADSAAAAAAAAMASAFTWPEGEHCRHEVAVALLSAVSQGWRPSMAASDEAFRKDARDAEAARAAAEEEGEASGSDSDSESVGKGHAGRSQEGGAAAAAGVGVGGGEAATSERTALLQRAAERSGALRWAECAVVVLGGKDLAAAAMGPAGGASGLSSGHSGHGGRRLVECLSWPCSDDAVLLGGLGGHDAAALFSAAAAGGDGGGGGGSSSAGSSSSSGGSGVFPSAAAPSAWVRLLALALRCVHGGCQALRSQEADLARWDDAARDAGGRRARAWAQTKALAAAAATAGRAELAAIDETASARVWVCACLIRVRANFSWRTYFSRAS